MSRQSHTQPVNAKKTGTKKVIFPGRVATVRNRIKKTGAKKVIFPGGVAANRKHTGKFTPHHFYVIVSKNIRIG